MLFRGTKNENLIEGILSNAINAKIGLILPGSCWDEAYVCTASAAVASFSG
jgi:hypothetical protein